MNDDSTWEQIEKIIARYNLTTSTAADVRMRARGNPAEAEELAQLYAEVLKLNELNPKPPDGR